MPRGSTVLRSGDHVIIAMRRLIEPLMDRLFDPYAEAVPLPSGLTLSFHAHQTMGQFHCFFGIPGPTWSTEPVGILLEKTVEGHSARLGPFLITPGSDPDYVTFTYTPESATAQDESERPTET